MTTHDLVAAVSVPERRLVWTNPAWFPLLGWAAEELRSGSYDRFVHPDDLAELERAGERPEIELRVRGSDGAYRRLAFSASRSPADGLVFLCATDVTAGRRDSLERRELERSNAELEHFAYVASHDLSEPLRLVSSYLQLLRHRYGGRLDDEADGLIDHAVDDLARMRDLVDDLLRYSRAGRGERPFEPVDTAALAERAAEAARAQGAQVRIGPLPTVHGDAQELGQVFQNLTGNAVKFVPGDRTPEVEISAERDGAEWRFAVADNGIGLEPGDADRVFRMFERLHASDDYSGTGIGLAIARKVVERHGGRIWAEPRPGGGSRFCFALPAEG